MRDEGEGRGQRKVESGGRREEIRTKFPRYFFFLPCLEIPTG
jgi:hypothetical protein